MEVVWQIGSKWIDPSIRARNLSNLKIRSSISVKLTSILVSKSFYIPSRESISASGSLLTSHVGKQMHIDLRGFNYIQLAFFDEPRIRASSYPLSLIDLSLPSF